MSIETTPFHAGELEAQRRAGVESIASSAGSFIRDAMPEQHRDFFAMLPFVVIAAGDERGCPWVTLLEGDEGFIAAPDPRTLRVAATLAAQDPLASAFGSGTEVGLLGIELATRRRNRANGVIRSADDGLVIDVRQSFGNCPQYIRERQWRRVEPSPAPGAIVSERLDARQRARIAAADTFFIGTGFIGTGFGLGSGTDSARSEEESPSQGFDASHRGGEPGFVCVAEDGTLQIPDYAGNNFFNTIGNLIRDPRVGLLFVDFETGGMLQITGRARIDWAPTERHDPNAKRTIEVTVERVVDRPAALALRWQREDDAPLRLEVVDKVIESDWITSFHLADAAGDALLPFEAGQHLAVELEIPNRHGRVGRSYSLSGSPFAATYRLSIKREEKGVASRFLHDRVAIGDRIEARPPSGDFVMPLQRGPLVLVSAGVGITPMLAMLHAAVAESASRPVWFVHGTRSGEAHAFKAEVDELIAQSHGVVRRTFYSAPQANDTAGVDYDAKGWITAGDLLALGAGLEAYYLLCGPTRFLAELSAGLEAGGVSPDRIVFETFGPTGR
ncbi:pyridoxamine 5'-phosphate oxidase family protein [Halomonas sp. HP20-15]|uniref:FAD-binding oxidoreductase n=1 Tax=Halomonas sp. HP20-15 TaxID=3085901 RepID=UPI0029828AE3|nr:pyridoxamine 5'-phosphate oxidase family protein [Halomonas sp. HP20-15]MDW5377217.1 pyridoxamine 5'-phosphate oxidase family protein [Halomonas sp. HP20-15]